MADAPPFKRGDIVIVNMPGLDDNEPAIVSHVTPKEVGVRWLMHKRITRSYGHNGADCMFWPDEYTCIEKVGHLDDF